MLKCDSCDNYQEKCPMCDAKFKIGDSVFCDDTDSGHVHSWCVEFIPDIADIATMIKG